MNGSSACIELNRETKIDRNVSGRYFDVYWKNDWGPEQLCAYQVIKKFKEQGVELPSWFRDHLQAEKQKREHELERENNMAFTEYKFPDGQILAVCVSLEELHPPGVTVKLNGQYVNWDIWKIHQFFLEQGTLVPLRFRFYSDKHNSHLGSDY